jgi:hypothetical protein
MRGCRRARLLHVDWASPLLSTFTGPDVPRRKSCKKVVILGAFSMMVVLMTMGCGALQTGPGTIGTPPGTFTVILTGSNASFTHSTTVTLTVE